MAAADFSSSCCCCCSSLSRSISPAFLPPAPGFCLGARHGTGGGGDDDGELQDDSDILEAGLLAMVAIGRAGVVMVPVDALYAIGWCLRGRGGVDFGLAGSSGRFLRGASGEEMGERTAHLVSGKLDDSTDANCGETT